MFLFEALYISSYTDIFFRVAFVGWLSVKQNTTQVGAECWQSKNPEKVGPGVEVARGRVATRVKWNILPLPGPGPVPVRGPGPSSSMESGDEKLHRTGELSSTRMPF